MGKAKGSVFLTMTRLCPDGCSTVNLVTDHLQRTCTGTIIIELSGSGYETSTQDNSGGGSSTGGTTGGSGSSGGGTSGNTSTEETQVNTGSWDNSNNGGGDEDNYNNGDDGTVNRQPIGDNVHLGPAGIGLLVMGFLILGCKCFNTSFGMGLSKKMGKEIGFSFLDKI